MDKLKQYCEQKGINMTELSIITGVSVPTLYVIDRGENTTIESVQKIFNGTQAKFGVGLTPYEYLENFCLAADKQV